MASAVSSTQSIDTKSKKKVVKKPSQPGSQQSQTAATAHVAAVDHQTTVEILEDDYRNVLTKYDYSKNKTRPVITMYEKTLLIGKRATMLAYGANPNIEVKAGMDVVHIAEAELAARKIPLLIRREIGDGKYEFWRPKDMIILN